MARAIFSGRVNVTCDDVRKVAHPVLRHRLFTNFNADAEGITPEKIVDRLLTTVPEPRPEDYRTPRAQPAAPSEATGEAVGSDSAPPEA